MLKIRTFLISKELFDKIEEVLSLKNFYPDYMDKFRHYEIYEKYLITYDIRVLDYVRKDKISSEKQFYKMLEREGRLENLKKWFKIARDWAGYYNACREAQYRY